MMCDVGTRVQLVMTAFQRDELYFRAHRAPAPDARASSLMRVLVAQSPDRSGPVTRYRVWCDEAAVAFIREECPDIARDWPSVFGDHVPVSRPNMLALIEAHAPGQQIATVDTSTPGTLILGFVSGDVLVVDAYGAIDWRTA